MFKNKTEASREYSRILRSNRLNKPIPLTQFEELKALLLMTRYANKVIQEGVTLVPRNVPIAQGRRVKMFCLEGPSAEDPNRFSKIPVSKSKVINDAYPVKQKNAARDIKSKTISAVRSALRLHIKPQIREFRDSVVYPVICSESNKLLRPHDKTHVDHSGDWTFVAIVEAWLTERGLYYNTISIKGPPTAKYLENVFLVEDWCAFHKDKATLKLVGAKANMAKGAQNWEGTSRWQE